jgi:hypothetical protein
VTPTTPDLGKLERDARQAAEALSAAKADQAAAAKVEADARHARSIEWAFDTIARYPQREAEAAAEVPSALAAFSAAALEDLPAAPAAYLRIAAAMARANALGEDVTTARNTLRTAAIIPFPVQDYQDPVGIAAPFPTIGMSRALPPFLDLLASTIDTAAAAALKARPALADPGAFAGQAPEAMRRDVLATAYRHDENLAQLAALQVQAPDRWATNVPADRKAAVAAWLACREAAGRGDEPLPKLAYQRPSQAEPAPFAPDDIVRVRMGR